MNLFGFKTARQRELEFKLKWGDLATYNSERYRGLVHTDEWQKKMLQKQKDYDKWVMTISISPR